MKRESFILIAALLLGVPLLAQSRPLTVTGVRGLTFGAVLPGVPESFCGPIPPTAASLTFVGRIANKSCCPSYSPRR